MVRRRLVKRRWSEVRVHGQQETCTEMAMVLRKQFSAVELEQCENMAMAHQHLGFDNHVATVSGVSLHVCLHSSHAVVPLHANFLEQDKPQ